MSWIILDRDGVINIDKEDYIRTPEQWRPIPNSLEAIALLHQHGFKIAIATNQAGIAKGYYSEATLLLIHQKMQIQLEKKGGKISDIAFCAHLNEDQCLCRKPQPGMLLQLAKKHRMILPQTPFVGDSLRDIQAAQAAGAVPVLVKTGNGAQVLKKNPDILPAAYIFDDLYAFAQYYCGEYGKSP